MSRDSLGALRVQAMAAVIMTLLIVVLLTAVGQGIGVGTSFISRHFGAGEYLEASRGASTALAFAAPIGVILAVALLPNLRGIFVTLGATPTITPMALEHWRRFCRVHRDASKHGQRLHRKSRG